MERTRDALAQRWARNLHNVQRRDSPTTEKTRRAYNAKTPLANRSDRRKRVAKLREGATTPNGTKSTEYETGHPGRCRRLQAKAACNESSVARENPTARQLNMAKGTANSETWQNTALNPQPNGTSSLRDRKLTLEKINGNDKAHATRDTAPQRTRSRRAETA